MTAPRAALKLVPATPDQAAAFDAALKDGGGGGGSAGGGMFDPDGRRVIQHDAGQLPRVLDELGAALSEFCRDGGNLFRWGAGLSRVYVAADDYEDGHKVKRVAGSVSLNPMAFQPLASIFAGGVLSASALNCSGTFVLPAE